MGLFFGVKVIFSVSASCLFPQHLLAITPWEEVWLVFWWSEPALDIEQGLLFAMWLSLLCHGPGMFPSCWSGSLQIHFWAAFWAAVWGRWNCSAPTGKGAAEYSSARAVNQWHCSVVLSVTHFAGLQSAPRLALRLAPSHLWKCWQWALVSIRYCFYKATSTDALKSSSRTVEVVYLDLLGAQWRQLRPWPSPAPMCVCPQSPQLLRPELSQPCEHLLSTQMSCRDWIYKASSGGVNLQLV